MYVLSVKGARKGVKEFMYLAAKHDAPNGIIFDYDFEKCMKFDSVSDAMDFATKNYTPILMAMLRFKGQVYTNTFAVRKINFKTVSSINLDHMSKENINNDNEQNEKGDNGSESESGMETEVSNDNAE